MTAELEGRVALVTGAGSGIGRAVALALGARGATLILVGRGLPALQRTAAAAGGRATAIPADLATEPGRAAVAATVPPALDVLVHGAGAFLRGGLETLDAAAWRALDALNLHAPVLLTRACAAALCAGHGQVVFVNSSAGLSGNPDAVIYGSGKHALRAAANAVRQELNPQGVRVLSIFPGRTDTPMQARILEAEHRAAPEGTLMRPDDVAAMILAALLLPRTAEVTELTMRPLRRL